MQKKFIKSTAIVISVAMVFALIVVFIFQNLVAYNTARERLDYLLDSVERSLLANDEEIKQLTISTGEDYLRNLGKLPVRRPFNALVGGLGAAVKLHDPVQSAIMIHCPPGAAEGLCITEVIAAIDARTSRMQLFTHFANALGKFAFHEHMYIFCAIINGQNSTFDIGFNLL